ncbi:hypothetical protein AYK25_00565 [Thermoplasmatales archaeon SM1-50]|nr:MAG: hypothetical protein AYK25_00565 [Thermoplasmatales archaeon SM1-50]
MTEKINLKKIEKKTYAYYHQDGLIDLFIGSGIIFAICCFLTELIWLAGTFVIFAVPLYTLAKQKITAPRIGLVKFGQKAQHRTLFIVLILIGNIFLIFVLGLFLYRNVIPTWIIENITSYPSLIVGYTGIVLILLSAVLSGIKRFYFYATSIFIIFLIGQLLSINLIISSALVAGVIILIGFCTILYFIHENPLSAKAILNEK